MTEKEKAKLEIKIANEEYRDPDFGFSWKGFFIGLAIGILLTYIALEIL